MEAEPQDFSRQAAALRVPALELLLGPHREVLESPFPFALGGDPCILTFEQNVPGAVVYCTSDLTGRWGSGQVPGPHGEYELVVVARPQAAQWPVAVLRHLAALTTSQVLRHGDAAGPVPVPDLGPLDHILFVDLNNPKAPFAFGGGHYGLVLCLLITEAEHGLLRAGGLKELVRRLRDAGAYPVSDPARPVLA
jgi:hypothetical protein